MEIKSFVVNMLQENTYVVRGAGASCVVVDPGFRDDEETAAVLEFLSAMKPEAVLLTHAHPDHIFGVAMLQSRFGIPVYMSPEDSKLIDRLMRGPRFTITPVADGSVVEAADLRFRVISTPGHSPGSVCWLAEGEKALFTGDTLFAGAIGRTDLVFGDYDDEIRSIMEKLMKLDGDTVIYPGHGGLSTIGTEWASNPFLEPFNEREEIPELQ